MFSEILLQYVTELNGVHQKYKETVPHSEREDYKLTGTVLEIPFLNLLILAFQVFYFTTFYCPKQFLKVLT